jgi:hypothetical protein
MQRAEWWKWMRALLPIATTLAAVRVAPALPPPAPAPPGPESCPNPVGAVPLPSIPDAQIVAPLLVPYAALAIIHMPTILLASQSRVTHIKQALASVATVGMWIALAAWAPAEAWNPPIAYAMSLHWALFLLAQPPHPTLAIGPWAHQAVCTLGVAILAAGAWHLGPPLPVVEVAGLPGYNGATAHLLCLLFTDLLGPALMHVLNRVLG